MRKVRLELGIDNIHRSGITGKNIGIAVLDTGVYPHLDFIKPYNRIIEFVDCINGKKRLYDDNGHGTHVCGIIGGNGYAQNGAYKGVAPRANLVVLKVLDKYGMGSIDNVIKALKWIIEYRYLYNIRIVNLSVGTYGVGKRDIKDLIKWVEKAWDSGLIVLTAAGNKGPRPMTITAPGTCKKIITVGSCEGNMCMPSPRGEATYYSGCGPTYECIVKPEVIAPGSAIISCSNSNDGYVKKSGTSMATPIVAGCIALVLEKVEHRYRLTNKEIKIALLESSKDMGYERNIQGWGKIDVGNMIQYLLNRNLYYKQ